MRGNPRALWSVCLGVLATLTLPGAIAATRYSDSYDLLHAGFAIPLVVMLGVGAVVLARRARALDRASLARAGGARAAQLGRLLGIAGLCMASSAAIALAVYEMLSSAG
jgi:peptidoglycan/LPS O-acetylase OafA/YrhL